MGSNKNGRNRTKQELKTVQTFPEQRGKYRPSFKFEDREFPLVKVVQFSEPTSGIELFLDIYHGLFPGTSYNDDERKDISFLDYNEAEWAMPESFDDPLLVMNSRRFNVTQLRKQKQPTFAALH